MAEPGRSETQLQYHRRRANELQKVRSPLDATYADLAKHIEPSRWRPTDSGTAQPNFRSRAAIIDSTGTFALRTLQSGMHSGITSPARPWFRLTTLDRDLTEFQPVKEWLSQVEKRMRETFQGSNIYTSFHSGYGDLGQFGQSVGLLVEDERRVVRMQQLLHGTFWIARDASGQATTLYRKFRWSVQRIVERFGLERVSQPIRSAYDTGRYDETFLIWHAVEPRLKRQRGAIDRANKPFLSNYWEDAAAADKLLEVSGFDENPIIAPPWELPADDHYAISPGMIALGDVKMLQKEQTRKLEGIDKMVRPPMQGPTSMMNNPASLLPGSVTYVDDPQGKGFRPAMEVNLRLSELAADIRETRDRINQAFYADLFLMLANMEGIQPRNTMEIAERKEEKLLALGPVLENIYGGQLGPVIERTYAIMERRGMLPPPPPDVDGQPIQIEYISMLAQAQKAVATGGVERLSAFVGSLAAVKPDALDKFDADQAIDVYADMLGTDPSIIIPDDEVSLVRNARAEAAEKKQQLEQAAAMAPVAKQGAEAAAVLAQADGSGKNVLQQLGIA